SNIQRDGDYDFYRFDAEFVITGPQGHTVSVQIANGFIGMLPSVVLNRIGSVDGLGPAGPTPTVDRPYETPSVRPPSGVGARAAGNGGLSTTAAPTPAPADRAAPMAFFDAPRSGSQEESERPPGAVPPATSPGVPVVGSGEHPVSPASDAQTGPAEVSPPAGIGWNRSSYSRPQMPGGPVFCVEVTVVETMRATCTHAEPVVPLRAN
ncbi:MAG: hypothetical protein ACJ72W_04355, partial [Actinoallomurus sp.]